MLAMLGRRREPGRVLVIGTLRRSKVAKTHALGRVIGELVTHRQARAVALDALPVTAVAEYLAQRFHDHEALRVARGCSRAIRGAGRATDGATARDSAHLAGHAHCCGVFP